MKKLKHDFFCSMYNKTIIRLFFVMSRIIEVSVKVFAKISSNNCLLHGSVARLESCASRQFYFVVLIGGQV